MKEICHVIFYALAIYVNRLGKTKLQNKNKNKNTFNLSTLLNQKCIAPDKNLGL